MLSCDKLLLFFSKKATAPHLLQPENEDSITEGGVFGIASRGAGSRRKLELFRIQLKVF
jgi:hypothetical protein